MAQQKRSRRVHAVLAAAAAVALTTAGCGGGSSSDSDSAAQGADSRGPITFVTGKDNSNVWPATIEKWNAAHPNEKVTLKEQSDQADQQHDDIVQHMQAKDASYDIVTTDVVWTAEFAAKGWLVPLKGQFALDTSKLLKPTVSAATYNGTLYAAPRNTNGGLLFYRKDLVPDAPRTWAEMRAACPLARENQIGCYAGQFAPYEGLTVNTAEVINAFGGTFVGTDGRTPTVNSPQSRAGLEQLVDSYRVGDIPREAITFQEPTSGAAFTQGKLMFLRSWPSTYGDASSEASAVKDKFGVAPLPGDTGIGASTLGGYNAAISAYSENKATALDFLKYLISEEAQHIIASGALPSVRASIYDDPALIAKMPYLPALKDSIASAVPRPVTPFYPAVSKAIQDNAYAALTGTKSVNDAIIGMQKGIETAGS